MIKINVYGIRGFPEIQGGVEKHCEELYSKIASENIQIKIFRRTPYVKKETKKYNNITFKDVWTLKSEYLETVIHSFLCAINTIRNKPDIVHIHNMGPALTLPLIKLFRIKTVVTLHSINYKHTKWNWLARFVLKISEKIAFKYADKIIFVSKEYMRNSITNKKFSKNKFNLIPNGITKFNNLKPDISLEKYNLKKDGYILFVGRIVQEKRIIDLISAFEKIKTTKKLVIVGIYDNNKNYYDELFKFKTKLENRLIFTGKLECHNVKLLYQNAYCFVLPSESEGMPIVLLEAMSFGKCPLVSDIKENLDVIENNGFSFRVKDEKDLQRKLEYMLKHKSEIDKKGKECKKLVEAKYNWDKIAKQTLKVYEDVLGKRK